METDQGAHEVRPAAVGVTCVNGDTLIITWTIAMTLAGLVAVRAGEADNATAELVACAKASDRPGFDAIAGCLMPKSEVAACWRGTRARLGLDA